MLHLPFAGLTAVPPAVFALKHLKRLDLGHNELTALPPAVGGLAELEELWLNGNPLLALPAELERCLALRVVDVRDTLVAALPRGLARLPALLHIGVAGSRLPPALTAAYARGGMGALLARLAAGEARDAAVAALRARLREGVFREEADAAAGAAAIDALVRALEREFPDDDALRTVARNAERLVGRDLAAASAAAARARYDELRADNARKAAAADVELAVRALYCGPGRPRPLPPARVDELVADLMRALPSVEDAAFLVGHARALLPPEPGAVSAPAVARALAERRAALAAERAAALAALTGALRGVYPERDAPDVARLAAAVAGRVPRAADVASLAGDAAAFFPPEFAAAKAKRVAKAWLAELAARKG